MIDKYDEIQEKVKLYEAALKGKIKSTQNLSSLGMKTILNKNKKIIEEKKQLQQKIIKARKLKIKVSQVLNMKILYSNTLTQSRDQSVTKGINIRSETKIKPNKQTKSNFSANRQNLKGRSSSLKALNHLANFEKDEGKINFFDNFTEQQLNQIEQNESYFLIRQDLIVIFRKYMVRKRSNNKDHSYQKFMLKSNQYMKFDNNQNIDKKKYILNILKIEQQKRHQDSHLLTNPIEIKQQFLKIKSKSFSFTPLANKKGLFSLLKDKQAVNKEKIIEQHRKKILDLKIDRNYADGFAAEKRSMNCANHQASIQKKNKGDKDRSILYRSRVNTVRDEIGFSIDLAETIRLEMLKRRIKNKKP